MTDKELSMKWHDGLDVVFKEIWNMIKISGVKRDKKEVEDEKQRIQAVDVIINKLDRDENVDKDVLKAYKLWTDYYKNMLEMWEEDFEEEKKKEYRYKLYQAIKVTEIIERVYIRRDFSDELNFDDAMYDKGMDEKLDKLKDKIKNFGGDIKDCINKIRDRKEQSADSADNADNDKYNEMVKSMDKLEKKLSNYEFPEKEEINNSYKYCKEYIREHKDDKDEESRKRLKQVKKMMYIIKSIPDLKEEYERCMYERQRSIEIMLGMIINRAYERMEQAKGGLTPKRKEEITIDNINKLEFLATSLRKENAGLVDKIVDTYAEIKPDIKKLNLKNRSQIMKKLEYLDKLENAFYKGKGRRKKEEDNLKSREVTKKKENVMRKR